ncbi:hypothetical protein RB597_001919 [Gaeumannomyces tritici]
MPSAASASTRLPLTPGQKFRWQNSVSASHDLLVQSLSRLYWLGIDRDLDEILRTLNMWGDTPEPAAADLEPRDWLGFEAFVKRATGAKSTDPFALDILDQIYATSSEGFAGRERLAQLLLQGAGMLDIDKVMEYGEPEYQLGQWLQPRALQLEATSPRDPREPVDFVALECSSCEKAIQGSHFECVGDGCACTHTHGRSVFCETCSREPNSKHRPDTLRKIHKRCVLSDCLSEEAAQRACRCPGLGAPSKPDNTTYSSSSSSGPGSERPQRPLFPFGAGDRDRHEQTCALARLRRRHERAKVTELQRLGMLEETPEGDGGEAGGGQGGSQGGGGRCGGVLFSIRDRLQLHPVDTPTSSVKQCYALSGNRSSLWSAKEHLPRHRRVKAFMKQVVGSPFWGVGGVSDTSMEARIVRAVAEASLKYAENPRKSARFNEQRKASLRGKILRDIQTLLHARLRSYLRAIAGRLLDREVPLAWHILDNNCQRFCDAIIDRRVFGSFMLHRRNESCVTRRVVPASRDAAANGHTEEFLLRHRRVGHHNDTDIVDGLTEYWTDWGGFRAPVFRHQGLFPWDCTEARTAADEAEAPQVRCGDCSLAKHLWAFPFDAWSVAQLHLCRERRCYVPASSGDAAAAAQLSLDGWRHNRLGVVEAMRALGGGGRGHARVARKRGRLVVQQRRRRWEGGEGGAAVVVVVVDHDRVKLAGVHRAQPASHLCEHSMLYDCTVAGWADMAPREQVAAYVALRDARAVDVDGVIKKAAREDASTGRSRRAEGGQDGSSQDPGGAALLDPGAASAQPIGEGGDAWEAYEAGDVVLEGHGGSGAQVYCDGQGTCDCVCDAAGHCDNAGVDYTDGGEAFTADGFVPFEIGDGGGNVGDGGGGDGGGGVGDGGGGGGGVGDGGGIGFVFFSIGDGGGGGGGGCGG